MLFNSVEFVIFALIVFGLYYVPWFRKGQVLILLGASAFFYAWSGPWLLILLTLSVLLNAFTSFKVGNGPANQRRQWATAGVVANLLILATFKYAGLLTHAVLAVFQLKGNSGVQALLQLPLPIGISFYTFEGISLLADTFRQKKSAEDQPVFIQASYLEHLKRTALFIAFFPHLVAGPILKARQFYPQISSKLFRDIDWEFVFRRLVLGYFLKIVIADNLKDQTGLLSYPSYLALSTPTGLLLLIGYSIQIYADFAGYSHIAIGLAGAFGYRIPDNFNFPYISQSLAEFWRRWHISLSTWLRDYLYFSLGGNRKGKVRTYINLIVVMALGGLWHGAAWSYMTWGLFHGFGLAIERALTRGKEEVWSRATRTRDVLLGWIRVLGVFMFVTFGWLFFKLPDFGQAMGFLKAIWLNSHTSVDVYHVAPVILYSIPVILYHGLNTPRMLLVRTAARDRAGTRMRRLEIACFGFLVFALFTNPGSGHEFIYFQF